MMRAVMTFRFFTLWGVFWGTLLGALAGTQILPYLGTIFSMGWGFGMGLGLGMTMGILAAIGHALWLRPETDPTAYRRAVAFIIGLLTGVAAPLIVLATSRGILWSTYAGSAFDGMNIYLILSMLAAAIWGSLAAAATAARQVDWLTHQPDPLANFGGIISTFRFLQTKALNKWVLLLGSVGGGIGFLFLSVNSTATIEEPLKLAMGFFGGMIFGVIAVLCAGALICLLNALLLGFLNRLFFTEYARAWSLNRYSNTVTVLCGLVTLVGGVWLAGVIFAPIAAAIMAWAGRQYALAYDEQVNDKPKRKSKPKVNEPALAAEA